ncbi:uncharacterized protein LOC134266241 isoform X2 [Saccostrea cucullata]|uniref:uncharacterized protein LOC134266241 isoform X2 n=1 Tax=Saccostrea cuccullata TaxID=36930 RepID=UPI002ED14071
MFCALTIIASTTCDGKSGVTCCFGYKWSNERQNCIKKTSTKQATSYQKTKSTNSTDNFIFTSLRFSTSVGITFKGETHLTDISTHSHDRFENRNQTFFWEDPNSGKSNTTILMVTQVTVVVILFLFVCLIIVYVVKKSRNACKFLKNKNQKKVADKTDHYLSLEDVEPLLSYDIINGSLFNGLAEVKINFDMERKQYVLGLRTQIDEKERQRTTSMNKQTMNTVEVLKATTEDDASSSKEFTSYDEPTGKVDVRKNFGRHESTASYLLVVPDNYSGDCTSRPPEINCIDKQN